MQNRPNPRIIPNNFRLQSYIDEELTKAKKLLEENEKDSADWVNIGLSFLEIGDWDSVITYSSEALKLEEAKKLAEQNNEIIASVHYMQATQKRELNNCDDALSQYSLALNLAQSAWLKNNILRNIGLAYLKKQDYVTAAKIFKEAFDLAKQHTELKGSLPALYNYYGLSLTKAALKDNQSPTNGVYILEETTQLYKTIFAEKEFRYTDQLRSHDWQSHQFHRGMILCEMTEKQSKDAQENERSDLRNKFIKAEELLLGALAGRIENKADDQRLGDIYVWLGRIAIGLTKIEHARQYFEKALVHYNKAFIKTFDGHEVTQIKDVRTRLEGLNQLALTLKSPTSFGQSIFNHTPANTYSSLPSQIKELDEVDYGFKRGFLIGKRF